MSVVYQQKCLYNNIVEMQNDKWGHFNKDFCFTMLKNISFSCTPRMYTKLLLVICLFLITQIIPINLKEITILSQFLFVF